MPINKLLESTVYRKYKCDNCKCVLGLEQKVKDKWKKKCPLCGKYKLYITHSELNISILIDSKKPKTIGSLAEKNRDTKTRRGEETKGFKDKHSPTPPWRKGKKINFNVLKNPSQYIEKGSV